MRGLTRIGAIWSSRDCHSWSREACCGQDREGRRHDLRCVAQVADTAGPVQVWSEMRSTLARTNLVQIVIVANKVCTASQLQYKHVHAFYHQWSILQQVAGEVSVSTTTSFGHD